MAQLKDTIINGDLNLSGTLTTSMGGGQHPLLDLIHPIGAVILTRDSSFNPSTYWGGTWYKWTDGYLKVDESVNTSNASTVGEYTISSNMLPKHTHGLNSHTHSFTPSGSISTTSDLTGSFAILDYRSGDNTTSLGSLVGSGSGKVTTGNDGDISEPSVRLNDTTSKRDRVSMNFNHSHSFTGSLGTTSGASGDTTDGGFSNSAYKPKYYAVIAWQRTA